MFYYKITLKNGFSYYYKSETEFKNLKEVQAFNKGNGRVEKYETISALTYFFHTLFN